MDDAAAIADLLHQDAPDTVRGWAANLPPWVSFHESPALDTADLEKR